MKLVFEDDFEQDIIDTTNWNYYSGSPAPFDRILPRGNCNFKNAAFLQKENAQIDNGFLNLIAKKETKSYQGTVDVDKGEELACGLLGQKEFLFEQSYTSASLFSKKGYNLGYFECRAKVPCTKGLYPVFWLWHHDEIVVFEFFGDSSKHYVSSHNKEKYVTKKFLQADYCMDFHTYAVNWTEESITWYFDNRAIWKICREEALNKENLKILTAPTDSSGNISESLPDIKNRWLRPNLSLRIYEWSSKVDETSLPDTLIVDYIRIYQNEKTN